ncbi:MAG TPA: glycosyltransferase [Gemmatimonadales bacterium]
MNILWVKTELLHPLDKGGKLRTFHMLRELKRLHRITYITLDDGDAGRDACDQAGEYCDELVTIPFHPPAQRSVGFYADLGFNLFSTLPYAVAKYRSRALRSAISTRVLAGDVDVVVCDFLAPSVNVAGDLPCPAVLFEHNVEALIWKRRCEVAADPLSRAYLRAQWERMRAFEARECRRYAHVVTVSPEDRAMVSREYQVDTVSDVPTGVDTAYFSPSGTHARDAHNMVFTGSMDWMPNDDAVRFCLGRIWPRIREALPSATFTVVGRKPSPALVALGSQQPGGGGGVTLTGRVDDVRPYMERAAVYLVPLRIGGGTRLKIFEAMAMGLPVVSTRIGAEGLPVTDGHDIVLADSPEDFAAAALQLLRDTARARAIGDEAARTVRSRAGWDRAATEFDAICRRVVGVREGALRS